MDGSTPDEEVFMPEVVIVALDINKNDDDFLEFDQLTAIEKIELIEKRIKAICEELETKEPSAAWILTWREYGITDGIDKRAVSSEVKAIFKEKMINLTKQYPNLSIVAGTISTKKHFNSEQEKKLDAIKEFYAEHGWMKEQESKFKESKFKSDKQQQIRKEKKKIKELKTSIPKEGFDVVRNTCYLFSEGTIWRHDKTAPMEETEGNIDLQKAIFQPGGSVRNINSLCAVRHPVQKRTPINLGIEICREHEFAFLKKTSQGSKPLIHFIMSDTTNLNLDHIHGEYAIQLDSTYKPRLILTKDEDLSAIPIRFYQNNLIKNENTLQGPLQPVYPFEKRVLNKLDSIIPLLGGDKRKILEHIKNKFIRSSNEMGCYSVGSYDCLEDLLNRYRAHLKNDYVISKFSLFREGPDLEKMVDSLLDLVQTERTNNPKNKDYLAVTDASPLSEEGPTLRPLR